MRKITSVLVIAGLILISNAIFAQVAEENKPSRFGTLDDPIEVPSIAQQILDGTAVYVDQNEPAREGLPKKRGANKHVPGKGLPHGDDPLVMRDGPSLKHPSKDPILVFDANETTATPSDPTGAIGPNHYIGAWNFGFRIFDKDGNPLTEEMALSTLFPGNSFGDPIVFYDGEADRFVITEFDRTPNGFNMAVCKGPDPVNDGWHIYTTGFETGSFPDYTKFAVWSDGYYVTANIGQTDKVFVVEREKMLDGEAAQFVAFPLPGITTSGFYSPHFFSVTDDILPSAGNASVVYMQDDAWFGITEDHLKVWNVNVDWANLSNSSISNPQEIPTQPFNSVFDGGSFSNVPQPSGGPDQDVLQATIMNQAQFRKFATYNSAVFNFVVDTDGTSAKHAGIRWFELRQDNDGDPWYIYQEGTYISPVSTKHAFSGSMVMDGFGNIGMGYTTCSAVDEISINFTGRMANDPLGQMTVDETLIAESNSGNSSNRLADYVQISVDPSNGKTFWHIAEYFNNGKRTDVVGVFQIASDYINDVGVSSIDSPTNGILSENEEITITVTNYGSDDQTDIPVGYIVDNGPAVNEIMTGTLGTGESQQYTFATTANLSTSGHTYEIIAFTSLLNDENTENDTLVKDVTYLLPDDIGVSDIIAPVSGNDLHEKELITVIINNFGGEDQTNFDVSYNLDGTVVTETVPGPLLSLGDMEYTFDKTGNFSEVGNHLIKSYTSLPGDTDHDNDTTSKVITKNLCQPESDCSTGDGLYHFKLGTIDNETDCSENGYGDYTDLWTELENNSTNELTVTTHYGDQYICVWIDYNDNFIFEHDELVVNNAILGFGQTSGVFTKIVPFIIKDGVNLGEHLMRAKTNWNSMVPPDACEPTQYGETEDYTAKVVMHLGTDDVPFMNDNLVIKTLDNRRFEISMVSETFNESLVINVHNILGQKLVENRIVKQGNKFIYELDMSYAEPGAYIIRLGNSKYGKVKKFIVK